MDKNYAITEQIRKDKLMTIRASKFFFLLFSAIASYIFIMVISTYINVNIPYMFQPGALMQMILIVISVILGLGFGAIGIVVLNLGFKNYYYDEFKIHTPSEVISPKEFYVVKSLNINGKIEDLESGKCKFKACTTPLTGETGCQEFIVDKWKIRQDSVWIF